jgi:FkbM family methyltransferase
MSEDLKLGILSLARRLDFRGKARLLDAVHLGPANRELAPADLSTVRCRYGIVIQASDNRDIMFRELLVNGHYQDDVLTALRHLLRPGDVFWDVGANYGFMSIFVEKAFSGQVTTISFEPSPVVLPELRRNLEINACKSVRVEPICISDRIGTVRFYVSKDHSWNATMVEAFARTHAEDIEVEVGSSTLDESVKRLPPPDVLKIDVEGAEPLVIAGGLEFLAARRPALVAEYNVRSLGDAGMSPDRYLNLFRELGYGVYMLRRPFVGRHRWSSLHPVSAPDGLPGLCNLILLDPARAPSWAAPGANRRRGAPV